MTKTALRFLVTVFAASTVVVAADLTDREKEGFLSEAEVVSAKELSVGVTLSQRLTLTDGALTHDAHFQKIDEFKPFFQGTGGAEASFRDSYRYNIAAYRLDRLLGLGMTSVSIERKHKGSTGAFTWWIDDVLMMELERWKKKIEPPDKDAWNHQMYQARLFNELVYNTDPNLGNVLIDKSWNIWLIDFTRAFRMHKKLKKEKNLGVVDRGVWEKLKALDQAKLEDAMDGILLKGELQGLLARRDVIVELLERRIASEGEEAVICDRPEHKSDR